MQALPPWPWQRGISRESPGWRSQGARLAPDRADPPNEARAATHCPLPRTGSRVRDLRKVLTTAPAALRVQAALPVQVLPAVSPVQVSQAPAPESAAMSRRSPELHPEISPIRN